MNLRNVLISIVTLAAASPCMRAGESTAPDDSLGSFAIESVVEKYRIYTDFCSVAAPKTKSRFDFQFERLSESVRKSGNLLLTSAKYKEMKIQKVPAALAQAMKVNFDNQRQQLATADASKMCPTVLDNLRSVADGKIFSEVSSTLDQLSKAGQGPAAASGP